jgi:uncharacterized membrane protein HdeD (DUF308 family)
MANTNAQSGRSPSLAGSPILSALAQNWWLVLLRGIAAIAFGVLAFFWPGITVLTLTLLWGAYAVSDGVFALWAAISGYGGGGAASRWWLALAGIAGILSGFIAFFLPGMTAFVLLMFIASWAIIIGVLQIWGAIQLRKELEGEWLLALNGLLSIAFGAFVIAQPGAGALAVVWIIAWYAILAGCIYIGLAFRLKNARP